VISQGPNNSPSRVSDDALAKMISEGRTTISKIPESDADIAGRLSRFNELYEALPAKPDCPSLMYKDPVTGSPTWSAIGRRLLVGRSPNAVANGASFVLQISDDEMSRQHFEIELTDDHLHSLNDLSSLNGTYVDGIRQERTVLIGGSEIRAGKTSFIFTGT
jgi:FHA domain